MSAKFIALAAVLTAFLSQANAFSVIDAISSFDSSVRNYNVITHGDANLSFINNDTEGPVAVGGNLRVGGVPLVNFNQFNSSPDPTLYVRGSFSIAGNNVVQLNNGYASLPGMSGLGTYPYQNNVKRYQPPGTQGWLQVNSNTAFSSTDPRTNPAPSNWNFETLFSQLGAASTTLAAASPNGSISVSNNKLLFTGTGSGVSLFSLDTNLLVGNQYAGQSFSGVTFEIPSDAVYVVNLLNADGKTVFGANGVNFNLTDAMAGRLLWNIVGSAETDTYVALGNGGEFHGSVLAPYIRLSNTLNTPINGQIVAEELTYQNAQIHFSAFSPPANIPEPAAYAAMVAGAALAWTLFRRRRNSLPS